MNPSKISGPKRIKDHKIGGQKYAATPIATKIRTEDVIKIFRIAQNYVFSSEYAKGNSKIIRHFSRNWA
jgi:hypothetical protein